MQYFLWSPEMGVANATLDIITRHVTRFQPITYVRAVDFVDIMKQNVVDKFTDWLSVIDSLF